MLIVQKPIPACIPEPISYGSEISRYSTLFAPAHRRAEIGGSDIRGEVSPCVTRL